MIRQKCFDFAEILHLTSAPTGIQIGKLSSRITVPDLTVPFGNMWDEYNLDVIGRKVNAQDTIAAVVETHSREILSTNSRQLTFSQKKIAYI